MRLLNNLLKNYSLIKVTILLLYISSFCACTSNKITQNEIVLREIFNDFYKYPVKNTIYYSLYPASNEYLVGKKKEAIYTIFYNHFTYAYFNNIYSPDDSSSLHFRNYYLDLLRNRYFDTPEALHVETSKIKKSDILDLTRFDVYKVRLNFERKYFEDTLTISKNICGIGSITITRPCGMFSTSGAVIQTFYYAQPKKNSIFFTRNIFLGGNLFMNENEWSKILLDSQTISKNKEEAVIEYLKIRYPNYRKISIVINSNKNKRYKIYTYYEEPSHILSEKDIEMILYQNKQ